MRPWHLVVAAIAVVAVLFVVLDWEITFGPSTIYVAIAVFAAIVFWLQVLKDW